MPASTPRPGGRPPGPTRLTKARRRAVDLLFEADQRGMLESESLHTLLRQRAAVSTRTTQLPPYTEQIVRGLAEHLGAVDATIRTYLHGWTLERLPAVDRAILRTSVWELIFNDDVDAPVTITEAMTIAAEISTDGSAAFLNAVLDRISPLVSMIRADIEAG